MNLDVTMRRDVRVITGKNKYFQYWTVHCDDGFEIWEILKRSDGKAVCEKKIDETSMCYIGLYDLISFSQFRIMLSALYEKNYCLKQASSAESLMEFARYVSLYVFQRQNNTIFGIG